MSSSSDLGVLLEIDTLTFLRTMGIFLVLSIALYSFTDFGKTFSLISLSIALVLTIAVVTNYFLERQRISQLGFAPRILIDILMYVMVFVIFFICWLIYAVWISEPTSLGKIAREIENKMDESNRAYLANLESIERHLQLIEKHGTEPVGNRPLGKIKNGSVLRQKIQNLRNYDNQLQSNLETRITEYQDHRDRATVAPLAAII